MKTSPLNTLLTAKTRKYRNVKCEAAVQGEVVVFDSIAEKDRYLYLSLLEKAGEIAQLETQPKFELEPGFSRNGKKHRPEHYFADFSYRRGPVLVVEDVKSSGTRTDLYKSKLKRFLKRHPDAVFIEVYQKNKSWLEIVQ
jgi:hypothetical protein